jgi:flagellar biosynthesis component FlhA
MKKVFLLLAACIAFSSFDASAQNGQNMDPKEMLQRMTERIKPELMQKTKLTDAQATKAIEVQFQWQRNRRELRMQTDLSDAAKKNREEEINNVRQEELLAAGFTKPQIASVIEFFEEQRKQQMEKRKGE